MGYISLIVYQKWQHVNIDSQRRKEKRVQPVLQETIYSRRGQMGGKSAFPRQKMK